MIRKLDRLLLTAMLVSALTGVVLPFFGIYLPKIVIDLLTGGAGHLNLAVGIGGFTALAAALYFLNGYFGTVHYWHAHKVRNDMMWRLFIKSLHCDYENIENARGQTKYFKSLHSMMRGDWSGINRLIPAVLDLLIGILGFVLYTGIIAMLNVYVIIALIMTSLVTYFALAYATKFEHSQKDNMAELDKKINYIQRKAADASAGKDTRIYRMKGWLSGLHEKFLRSYTKIDTKVQNRNLVSALVNALVIILRDGFAYVYLIYAVLNARISVGEFVLYFGAISGFSNWITQIISQFNALRQASLQISDMREFFELQDASRPGPHLPVPEARPLSIEFRNVSFRYDENGEDVIKNLNLTINAGEKLAVVGVSGAGKTTLIKLLCGLYSPRSGEILINGVNIARVEREALFGLFSAVFQEPLLLPFTIAENISLKIPEDTDMDKVREALNESGLGGYVEKLPKGINSPMLKVVEEDGIVLSGGQQQMLLLARALYKDAPILLLDEPTAALDPIAESDIYQKYRSLTAGKTAVYISHRLASTRFCDRIVYLSGGKILEEGSHEELMRKNGEYARMFEIQSHYYRKTVPEREEVV
jgi:ATP-binding cassette subfamily B protein/ATP-binding cassette subfamily C protein